MPRRPTNVLTAAFLCLAAAVLLGLVIPGAIAAAGGTLTDADVEARCPPAVLKKLNAQRARDNALETGARRLEEAAQNAASGMQPTQVDAVAHAVEALRTLPRPPTIHVRGFLHSDVRPLWPLLFFFLGILIFVFPPIAMSWHVFRPATYLLPLLWICHRWPTWLRNTRIGSEGRRVYNDANWDISRLSFLTQEGLAFIACALIVALWCQWSAYYRVCADDEEAPDVVPHDMREHRDMSLFTAVTSRFRQGILATFLLLGAFSYYSYFFWKKVAVSGDFRYLASALTMHVIWSVSLVLVALPFAAAWQLWAKRRLAAVLSLYRRDPASGLSVDEELKVIAETTPLSVVEFTGAAFVGLGGLLFPLLQALWL